jgi:hypothetical protein
MRPVFANVKKSGSRTEPAPTWPGRIKDQPVIGDETVSAIRVAFAGGVCHHAE